MISMILAAEKRDNVAPVPGDRALVPWTTRPAAPRSDEDDDDERCHHDHHHHRRRGDTLTTSDSRSSLRRSLPVIRARVSPSDIFRSHRPSLSLLFRFFGLFWRYVRPFRRSASVRPSARSRGRALSHS